MTTKPAFNLAGLPGVGKTSLIEGLLSLLKTQGKNPAGFKPFDAGLIADNALERRSDCERIAALMSFEPALGLITPYTGHEDYPIELALRRDGTRVDWKFLNSRRKILLEHYDLCLSEMPGGLATPLTEQKSVIDWLKETGDPLIYLIRPEPSGLNQMLLELELLNRSGLDYHLIFCNLERSLDGDWIFYQWEKAEALAQRQAMGMLPFLKDPSPKALGQAIETHLPKLVELCLGL
ncbi:MAG: AAA family ATPase [bacterium]|nr:AAA family ATPase [bacterium]